MVRLIFKYFKVILKFKNGELKYELLDELDIRVRHSK